VRPLTLKQELVLGFIKAHIAEKGYPPTLREMCRIFRWSSVRAATCHLRALAKKGYIRYDPRISRGIAILAGKPTPGKFWHVDPPTDDNGGLASLRAHAPQ
jgi:SOS-response transcriptional repressor LexA